MGPGGDLFVGTSNEVRAAHLASGRNVTHTPHHVVQAAIRHADSRGAGVAIHLRKDLHTLTRTLRRPVDLALNLRTHVARDMRDVRRILHEAGYAQAMIHQQLQELVRQNKALGGFEK